MSISHPHRDHPKVPLWLLVVLAIIAPLVCITSISLLAKSPKSSNGQTSPLRTKLQSLNVGVMGLGVSLGIATIVYTGVKNLTGKPRPDFLAICQPRLTEVPKHAVGGLGQGISPLWVMVDRQICQQPDKAWLNDAMRSFPSGYATSQ